MMPSITRPGTTDHLPALLAFVEDACRDAGAPPSTSFAMKLAVEEVCMNIMQHGYSPQTPGPISVTFEGDREHVIVTVADRAAPFAPEDAPEADLTSSWDERRIGGLGWHLVKQMVDEIDYRAGGSEGNVLTLIRRNREESHAG